MAAWSDSAYSATMKKFPVLEGKSETVAFAVSLYDKSPKITTDEIREKGAETGLAVRGRAIGSARQIIGLAPLTGGKKKGKKRGKKAGARPGRKTRKAGGAFDLGGLADSLRQLERDRQQTRAVLEKIRDLIDRAL